MTWVDKYGNSHDLDFVIEKGGTSARQGRPVAFIESAWRRYTKHSRNKAQEIQGALLPIAEKHEWDRPFLGAILAGIFTRGSLDQLRSVGFHVLYFPYDSIVAAFEHVGIDVRFDESTPDAVFRTCVEAIDVLGPDEISTLTDCLISGSGGLIDEFLSALQSALDRMIERLVVIPMFGYEYEFSSIEGAVDCIEKLDEAEGGGDFRKYEVIASFSNGDSIAGSFKSKAEAMRFLRYLAG